MSDPLNDPSQDHASSALRMVFPPLPHDPHAPPPLSLHKQRSWSPDAYRDEAWLRRKKSNNKKKQRSKSVTDEDVDELKACIELGFGFDSPEADHQRLSDTLPALGLYYAVNKHYYDSLSKPFTFPPPPPRPSPPPLPPPPPPPPPPMTLTASTSSTASDCETPSPMGSPHTMFDPDDTPQTMKTRLRQWAQVVACSVRQCSS
ncbi:uncharacterized protein LOC133810303 [Humulus lupulus]|uniref:uncharacterized protein LOC133810303 n=1 Tax=Humulus lupulus TaxID=3486 RepID=UPI002B4046B7|nr:uncharacterized protein LOC133810303 [Humulus lupulus]